MSAATRIQWFHTYVVNKRYPNAQRLAERFDISHRQAQRDLDTLRRAYGAPLAYSAEHRGFYYTEDYQLPSYRTDANDTDYTEVFGGGARHDATQEILQMQIPYSAVLRIPDKLTQMELGQFITGKESPGNYVCEFHSVEMFLGLILGCESDITIISPAWLRRRLVESAERVLRNNAAIQNED